MKRSFVSFLLGFLVGGWLMPGIWLVFAFFVGSLFGAKVLQLFSWLFAGF